MTAPRPAGSRYAFLPYYRTGAVSALRQAFRPTAAVRATMTVSVAVRALPADQDVAQPPKADVNVTIRGPGDVVGVDPVQIIRRHPAPGTVNAEPGDLAHIEFDRPDLPWQFTPTGPGADGNLPPWLRLVVVDAANAVFTPRSGDRLATVEVPATELPPPDDAWAWAHAQVIGSDVAGGLDENNPALNLSRLLCPRRLTEAKEWIACLVPVFRAGQEAGLTGTAQTSTLAYAWRAGDARVVLPVYDSWTFRTGRDGDFATLAGRLRPPDADSRVDVGIRHVDTGHPGNGIVGVGPGDPGRRRSVRGALVAVDDPLTDAKKWPAPTTAELRRQLEAVAGYRYEANVPATPTVGPPLYGGAHIARGDVSEAAPGWFRTLNLDPADRLVAGLGTRVVQMDQEDLMASAWAQVGGVLATNQALRLAQLGRYVSESLHRRLEKLDGASLLTVTNPVTGRLPDPTFGTLRARLAAGALPLAAIGQLRRFAPPRGPATRFAGNAASRTTAVRRLLTDDAGRTRSWVRPLGEALGSGSPAVLAELGTEIGFDAASLVALSTPDLRVAADGGAALRAHVAPAGEVVARVLSATLDRLIAALPAPDDNDHPPHVVTDVRPRISELLRTAQHWRVTDWSLSADTARRIGLDARTDERGRQTLRTAELVDWWSDPGGVDTSRPGAATSSAWRRDTAGLFAAAATAPVTADTARPTLAVSTLKLVPALQPSVTTTRRVLGRLPRLVDWPEWLPPDWFDDRRVEPVLAGPRFDHPMYEALHRYDPEWLMPGVADIQPAELVTVLQTNRRFVEAFLVGCNTEFASELVWRGYPSDGRATSFRSFWTAADELTQPVHRFDAQAPLGGHLRDDVANALVVVVRGEVVRRYPTMLAALVTQRGQGDPPSGFNPLGAATPLFRLHLDPDILLLGFSLPGAPPKPAERLQNPPPGKPMAWWFTLSEHVGEPRFGLLEGDGRPSTAPALDRDGLTWDDLDPRKSGFLPAKAPSVPVDGAVMRADSARFAWLLFRHPERAAFAARDILIANRMRSEP
ncbi:hypothetical protein [Mycolicibacterium monacense]|uniref:Uncharacterized protein n=2 Tax=Mycobacteriaceae TaxID=1762 RepID=A0AAD1N0E9_MYCMB|nr:hypothetical protein [Mycolicibacterium monacense]MDA4100307.1 hypothetical protein [Mycolicibacterium monacense DSM 44395]ORB22437.1 hypothetical protein BST34_07275 [Mycolicibacterium monacense DSM 44395]QHP84595.1 hypothetical protein EWR22_03970 [Mycolicibacterium monacense DSM 44395]BBZ62634.1 hypothetical protein MMON_39350 [Mycolicibacterium monacense]